MLLLSIAHTSAVEEGSQAMLLLDLPRGMKRRAPRTFVADEASVEALKGIVLPTGAIVAVVADKRRPTRETHLAHGAVSGAKPEDMWSVVCP